MLSQLPSYIRIRITIVERKGAMEKKLICAIFFGEAETRKKAEQIAESYQKCPYIHLMATKEKQLFATFFLPEKQRWWIEYVEKKPHETFGLEKAKVIFADFVQYPEKLEMRVPEKPLKISPCGGCCAACPAYEKCLGCPATTFYKHTQHNRIS